MAPARAQACSCPRNFGIFPKLDAQELPLNVRVWEATYEDAPQVDQGPVRLHEVGTEVLIDTEVQRLDMPGDDLVILSYRPVRELTPRAFYDARVYAEDGTFSVMTRFSVGDARDDEPPAFPTVDEVHTWAGPASETSSCGNFESFGAMFRVGYDGLVVVDRDGQSTLTDQPAGQVTAMSMVSELVTVGYGACLVNWPEADEGATAVVRLGQFDLAGNFSGWDAGTEIEIPELPEPQLEPDPAGVADRGCTCRSEGSPLGPWGALGVLLGLGALGCRRGPRGRRGPR